MRNETEVERISREIHEFYEIWKRLSWWDKKIVTFKLSIYLYKRKMSARLRTLILWAGAALAGAVLGLAFDFVPAFFGPWSGLAVFYAIATGLCLYFLSERAPR